MRVKKLEATAALPELTSRAFEGIGIIVPFDFALDREYWRYVPEDTQLHLTRTAPADGPISSKLAEAVGDEAVVRAAAASLTTVTSTVVYACTSGSYVNGLQGEKRLRECMEAAGATTALTTSGALLAALKALDVRKVAVVTPYDVALTEKLVAFLTEGGLQVTSSAGMGLTEKVHAVPPSRVVDFVLSVDHSKADAVFLSCTGFATYTLTEGIEATIGKPFLSANQVTMWAALLATGSQLPSRPDRLFQVS